MFRSTTLAILCLAATPALAQNTTAPAAAPAAPSQESITAIQTAAAAFGQCIQTGVAAVPASVTPEAGATNVLNGCATQRTAVEAAVQAMIATLPEAQRTMAQEQLRSQVAGIPTQIADGIRQSRGAAAPAATPTPTPAH